MAYTKPTTLEEAMEVINLMANREVDLATKAARTDDAERIAASLADALNSLGVDGSNNGAMQNWDHYRAHFKLP